MHEPSSDGQWASLQFVAGLAAFIESTRRIWGRNGGPGLSGSLREQTRQAKLLSDFAAKMERDPPLRLWRRAEGKKNSKPAVSQSLGWEFVEGSSKDSTWAHWKDKTVVKSSLPYAIRPRVCTTGKKKSGYLPVSSGLRGLISRKEGANGAASRPSERLGGARDSIAARRNHGPAKARSPHLRYVGPKVRRNRGRRLLWCGRFCGTQARIFEAFSAWAGAKNARASHFSQYGNLRWEKTIAEKKKKEKKKKTWAG